jgi:hypothetical protein
MLIRGGKSFVGVPRRSMFSDEKGELYGVVNGDE